MTGTCVKIGLMLESLGSGLWYLGSSTDGVWLPLIVGVAGAVPLVRGWADTVFQGGRADLADIERLSQST